MGGKRMEGREGRKKEGRGKEGRGKATPPMANSWIRPWPMQRTNVYVTEKRPLIT